MNKVVVAYPGIVLGAVIVECVESMGLAGPLGAFVGFGYGSDSNALPIASAAFKQSLADEMLS